MKLISLSLIQLTVIVFSSCGTSSNNLKCDAKGFSNLEKEFKKEFGDQTYYSEIAINYNDTIGNIISTTLTNNPESFSMHKWSRTQGVWNKISDFKLEIPTGTKARDFMFQLDEEVSLRCLGKLLEKSSENLKQLKNINNPRMQKAFIKFQDNGYPSDPEYCIMLQSENGGTTYSYSYKLNGEFIKIAY